MSKWEREQSEIYSLRRSDGCADLSLAPNWTEYFTFELKKQQQQQQGVKISRLRLQVHRHILESIMVSDFVFNSLPVSLLVLIYRGKILFIYYGIIFLFNI